ncbi:MAG: NAD(P)-binding protein [Burkholderiales bacterium]|nr:NAD(P)-binding protein [Burkholderiales bacterium]
MFSPISIGNVRLPNRFAMAPMTTNYADTSGAVTDELIDYLAARAAGGFGLIVTENIGVHPSGRVMPRMLMGHEDRLVPGLARLTQALQARGARVFGQLSHCGRQSRSAFTGGQLLAPSAIACPVNREMPHALADDEITALIRAFADAAARLDAAGFDGIELHGAHGYLIGEFLSPYSNHRNDAWGGSPEKRLRFLREIIAAIRARTSLPLSVRLSAEEFVAGGYTIADTLPIAQTLAAEGVAAISVSVGVYESFNALAMVSGEAEGKWLALAGAMRRALPAEVVVFGVGRIRSPELAERALADGCCDIPLFGRSAIADAAIPNKAAGIDPLPVAACLSCNMCLGRSAKPETICPVDPAVGHDRAFHAALARHSDARLTIFGSGLAALTLAWMAARRGADVELCDEAAELGGMLAQRSHVPGQQELGETVRALWTRAQAAGVRRVGRAQALTRAEAVAAPSPDSVSARGGGPRSGRIRIATRRYEPISACHAVAADECGAHEHSAPLTVYRILDGSHAIAAGAVYFVLGDDLASTDAALVLAAAGAAVRLISPSGRLAWDAHPGFRVIARSALERHGVPVLPALPEAATREPGAQRVAGAWHGHPAPDDAAWRCDDDATGAELLLDEAWEPAAMTRGVYAAADWAQAPDTLG